MEEIYTKDSTNFDPIRENGRKRWHSLFSLEALMNELKKVYENNCDDQVMKQDVVIMAELDWAGLYSQSHVLAKGFAEKGHRVFYMNRTLQRWPKLRHLLIRLMPKPNLGITSSPEIPEGITVINLWVGPPVRWLRFINRCLIRFKMRNFNIQEPVFITYLPTFNSIDLSEILKVKMSVYICYHNFDADVVVPDLLISEKLIIKSADLLFADSRFLMQRLTVVSGGKQVYQSPPGVHFNLFKSAYRGDEILTLKKIAFYGGAGPHLDINLYNSLCNDFAVIFIAVINPVIKEKLDSRIVVIDPVPNDHLPELLKEVDILTILYKRSDYIDGVIPAKFFECIATGKPVLVSGLREADAYTDYVYETGNDHNLMFQIIRSLPDVHTKERVEKQFQLGKESDFNIRFLNVYNLIIEKLDK